MEVILINPVKKLGKIGEVIKVKDGFARNYLIPQKFAIMATEPNKAIVEEQQHELELKDKEKRENALSNAAFLKKYQMICIHSSAEDGRLFGSVSNKDIALNLSSILDQKIFPANVMLPKPIKTVGYFSVGIRLHAEISSEILVVVARSRSEAEDYLMQYHSSQENKLS
jgi:large subunit ribosomal protein L9